MLSQRLSISVKAAILQVGYLYDTVPWWHVIPNRLKNTRRFREEWTVKLVILQAFIMFAAAH
jgi:hypothetical protein